MENITIHVWEIGSNQTTEVRNASSIYGALMAYVDNAILHRWNEWERTDIHEERDGSTWYEVQFVDEVLTLRPWANRNSRVWSAEWRA